MRFNSTTRRSSVTSNFEGATAYGLSPELELYAAVVTSSLSNKFYEATDDRMERLRGLISRVDPLFVARLAVYAREQMYLRSIPLVLAVELARIHSGDDLVARTVSRVVQRADEITELLAYYQHGRTGAKKLNKLSKQVQKGLALAFNSFSEYQFAKYDRQAEVSLRDALFLVHPKAKDDTQRAVFDKIAAGTLAVPYTWEVELTKAGKDGRDKRLVWEELIDSGKVGYMALLRNLRNMLEAGVSTRHLSKVCQTLADPEEIRKSKQLPFRFLSAFREVQPIASGSAPMLLNALEDAVRVSAENIRGYDHGQTVVIACDVSGSMQEPISERSSVQNYDIGLILAMLLQFRCKSVITGIFGDVWATVNLPQSSILSNAHALRQIEGKVGYSTNGHLVLVDLLQRGVRADKILFFTDCQLWDSGGRVDAMRQAWSAYRQEYPEAKLYLFDLAGYGNTPVSTTDQNVFLIAGWSDKVFDVLAALESGSSALGVIEGIDL